MLLKLSKKINDLNNFHLKMVYIVLAMDSVRHVTSQEDMSDRLFLPLDVASSFVVVFLCF